MSEPYTIKLDVNKHLLRVSCGQCGDTHDMIFDAEPVGKSIEISATIMDQSDYKVNEEDPQHLLTPIHVVV